MSIVTTSDARARAARGPIAMMIADIARRDIGALAAAWPDAVAPAEISPSRPGTVEWVRPGAGEAEHGGPADHAGFWIVSDNVGRWVIIPADVVALMMAPP